MLPKKLLKVINSKLQDAKSTYKKKKIICASIH